MKQLAPPRLHRLRTALSAVVWCAATLLVATPCTQAVGGVGGTSGIMGETGRVGPVGSVGAGEAAERNPSPELQLIEEQRHVADLEASLGQLRTAAKASQLETANLQARLDEALTHPFESGQIFPLAWVAALLTLTLLLLGGLLWHESRQRKLPWWLAPQPASDGVQRVTVATSSLWPPALPDRQPQGPGTDVTPSAADATDATAAAAAAAVEPAPASTARIDDLRRADPTQTQPMPLPAFELNAGSDMTLDSARLLTEGAPGGDLSIQALTDLAQQADFLVALGQDDAAVDLLMGLVRSNAQTGAMPYLKLLKIYRRRSEHDAYERIRERFNRRFKVSAPEWASFATDAPSDSRLDQLANRRTEPLRVDTPTDGLRHTPTTTLTPLTPLTEAAAPVAGVDAIRVTEAEIDLLLPLSPQRALLSYSDLEPWLIRTAVDLDLSEPSAFTRVPSSATNRPTFTVKTRDHGSSAFER